MVKKGAVLKGRVVLKGRGVLKLRLVLMDGKLLMWRGGGGEKLVKESSFM